MVVQSVTVTSEWERVEKGIETRRLHRLHFNSTLPTPNLATNCPHSHRASDRSEFEPVIAVCC